MSKYTYDDVLKSFEERGYTLLTTKDEYKSVTQNYNICATNIKIRAFWKFLTPN